ncbi:hypothetical protein [Comamonas sp. JC664]|uniref:hypothetical protein n=1 Tax=Comamonas sp. JC664 TaxID=2801917 RepID=UPI00174EC87F|nr:hypothetical protein [Comamonas sp. JC664]MBL0692530.1 hypothetical protein [Comamonas sp. JC664]GHG92403.1 hypothetical protein GCM10012319_53910 [Comamonas sp. KCTC 72670]
MKQWLAVTLGAVIGLGAAIPPLAMADTSDAELDAASGPCFLELICDNGRVLSCNAFDSCHYRPDAPGAPGYVVCDGAGWACNGDIW